MRSRVVVAVVALGCLGLGLTGCTPDESDAAQGGESVIVPGKPGEPNRTLSPEEAQRLVAEDEPNDADFAYVEMMIVHHQQAIEMTTLAAKHADDEQVRGIADRIADAQGPEITMMNTWLTDNGRKPVDTSDEHSGHGDHGAMPGMASAEEMKELADARGAQFDRLFLKLMITHHEGALDMARDVQVKGSQIRVQEMANDVIATQAAEIEKMTRMLDS